MTKPWITTEIYTHAEQKILIQPTPEFDGIEVYFKDLTDSSCSNAQYINKEELPYIIEKLIDMMEYATKK